MTTQPESVQLAAWVEGRLWVHTLVLALVGSVAGAAFVSLSVIVVMAVISGGAWDAERLSSAATFFLLCLGIALIIAIPMGLSVALPATIGGTIGKHFGEKAELWSTAAGGGLATILLTVYAAAIGGLNPLVTLGTFAVGSLATLAFVLETRGYRRKAGRTSHG